MKIKEGEYENTEIDFLEDLSNAFGIDRASKFRYANFYYDIDKIKDLSEEELDEKLKNIVRKKKTCRVNTKYGLTPHVFLHNNK